MNNVQNNIYLLTYTSSIQIQSQTVSGPNTSLDYKQLALQATDLQKQHLTVNK